MINQQNSMVSLAEQMAVLNKNSMEVMTKLTDVVTSRNSVVNVNLMNTDGTTSSYQFPTVGQLKNELDIANRNIQKLAGLADSTAYVSDGTTMRRIYVDDLNSEPSPIDSLDSIKKFTSINNSFFESLYDPMLAIQLDLTDKIDQKVKKVLSRRYIINFQKDQYGNLTSDGANSKSDFETNFLNRNDVFIDDLTSWYTNVKNTGVFHKNQPYDEQIFELDYDKLQYHGIFDVVGIDNDTINNKMWYVLGSITYYDYTGNTRQLSVGDELIINKKDSSTLWYIKEVSTAKSNYRVILERVEGLEPVPILTQGLKIYSPVLPSKTIKISIGYDEYNVVFIKPINTDANVVSSTWSYGTSFYSNNLVLDTNSTVSMTKFYSDTVFDYGSILKDLISKNIPSKFGVTPNIPNLVSSNFKVIQINKHLTDTADSAKIQNLNTQKVSIKSQLEQLSDAIVEQNKELSTKQYKSTSDKQASQNKLSTLISQQSSLTKSYTSIVSQINAENTGSISSVTAKFRVRGFWSVPEPVIINTVGEQQKQEVVQFIVQYRYKATGGSEPTTEGFNLNITETIYTNSTSTGDITDQTKAYLNPSVTTQNVTETGYFSNWNQYMTEARKRTYNRALDAWTWDVENVSDANSPKVNQLDISLQPNETVEIRIKSVSEVGFPDSLIVSDWSDIMTIDFPTNLAQVGNENSTILQSAQNEQIYSQIESDFNSKGLTTHLQQSYYVNDLYVAHTDVNVGTSVKDSSGNIIMLNDYLKLLTDRITALEEIVSNAKGELSISLYQNSNSIIIRNGASVTQKVICENYAEISNNTRTYYNNIYSTSEYYLEFDNISKASQLGLLSYRKYVPDITGDNRFYNHQYSNGSLASYIDSDDLLRTQVDNQFVWISDTSGTNAIYNSGKTYNSTGLGQVLYSKNWNVGLTGTTVPNSGGTYSDPINIFNDINWTGITWSSDNDYETDFPVTIHPYIDNIKDFVYSDNSGVKLINSNNKFILPIKIFFKLSGGTNETVTFPTNLSTSPSVTRKLRIFVESESLSRPFEFEIIFNVFRNKTSSLRSSVN